MTPQGKNVLIGLFAVIALLVAVWGLLFLNPRVGNGEQVIRIRLSSVEGIEGGTRVTFAGKPVGRVAAINQIPDAREQPVDAMGKLYFYEVILAIDSSVQVYETDEVVLATTGLFGEKSIAIIPRASPEGTTPVLVTDQILYGLSAGQMEQTFTQLVNMADQMGTTFGLINNLLLSSGGDLHKMVRSVAKVADETAVTMRAINSQDLIANTSCAMKGVCSVMERVDAQIATYQEDGFFDRFATMVDHLSGVAAQLNEPGRLGGILDNINTFMANGIELEHRIEEVWPSLQLTLANVAIATRKGRQVLDHLEEITDQIAQGHGSLGQLIQSDELYMRMVRVMSKAETLMNDLNQYGVLFHMNKGWQRQRSGRAAQISNLNSAHAFHCYFDQEIDQINTALGRVGMLIDRAKQQGVSKQLANDHELSREVVSLVQRFDRLEERLQHLNEEIAQ